MTSLKCSQPYQTQESKLQHKVQFCNGNLPFVEQTPELIKSSENYSVVNLFFNVSQKLAQSKLRSILTSEYKRRGFLVNEQIKILVQKFVKELTPREKENNVTPMHQTFICKCQGLLYNPATLPCGHTMCKHCADENLFCVYCGYTIEDPCHPNLFLVQLISLWFPQEYTSTRHKKDAKTLYESQDYELALNEINLSISFVDDDYAAYKLRAEIYLELQEYKKALADATKSCNLNTECGKSQFVRGNCFSHLGKLNQAIDAFQLCLELEPEDMALCNSVISRLDTILSLPELSDGENSSGDESKEDNVSNRGPNVDTTNAESSQKSSSANSCTQDTLCKDEQNSSEICTFESGRSSSSIAVKEKIKTIHGVNENLIKEEDFECKLCYELMFKPITTSCGHVFCKNCLLRSLDHNAACPICRLSLNDFLKNPRKPATSILEEILELFFNEQFAQRKKIHQDKMEKLSRVGVDESVEIPIFVCAIAFPYVKSPFHIFEPKYRLMIRECIESGSRKFGMCVPQLGGGEDYSDIGTICEINKIQNLPDGRYIINATAGQRFIVQHKNVTDSMNYAKVRYFTDEPEDLNNETFATFSRGTYDHLSQYVTSLNETEQDCIFNAMGKLPAYEEDLARSQHGVAWVWWGLAALPLNFTAKLVLLRSKCVSERMLSLRRFLRFLSRMHPTPTDRPSAPVMTC